MHDFQIFLSELAGEDAIDIAETVHMLQEVFLPESHIFLIGVQGEKGLLKGQIERVQVWLGIGCYFAP